MRGYFARLLRQTGVTVGPAAAFTPAGFQSHLPGATNLLEAHERKLIQSHREESSPEMPPLGGCAPDEDEDDSIRQSEQQGSAAALTMNAGRLERDEAVETEPTYIPRYSANDPLAESATATRLLRQSDAADRTGGGGTRSTTVSAGSLEREQVQEDDDAASEKTPVSRFDEIGVALDAGRDGEEATPPVAWHTALREARKWVSATPLMQEAIERQEVGLNSELSDENKLYSVDRATPLMEEAVERQDVGLNSEISDKGKLYSVERATPRVGHADPIVSSEQAPEPESQEFHLSIGSINLTVEEPPSETEHRAPQQISAERTPARERGRSRLSRHYLRAR